LYAAAASPEVSQRETAIYVLYSILDTVAESFDAHMKELFPLFAKSLMDPQSSEVRITTLRALAKVAEYIEPDAKHDIKAFQDLIMPMLQVIQQAVNDDDEPAAKHGFDLFETLLIIETPLVSKHVGEMVEFFISIGGNKEADSDIRIQSLGVLSWIVR
jgi:hypothetical protein